MRLCCTHSRRLAKGHTTLPAPSFQKKGKGKTERKIESSAIVGCGVGGGWRVGASESIRGPRGRLWSRGATARTSRACQGVFQKPSPARPAPAPSHCSRSAFSAVTSRRGREGRRAGAWGWEIDFWRRAAVRPSLGPALQPAAAPRAPYHVGGTSRSDNAPPGKHGHGVLPAKG